MILNSIDSAPWSIHVKYCNNNFIQNNVQLLVKNVMAASFGGKTLTSIGRFTIAGSTLAQLWAKHT